MDTTEIIILVAVGLFFVAAAIMIVLAIKHSK
jgi:hypothetical protein